MPDGLSGISNVAEHAAREFRRAENLERREPLDRLDEARKTIEAERARADGERLLKAPTNLVGDTTTEIVPGPGPDEKMSAGRSSPGVGCMPPRYRRFIEMVPITW
jgi:hypothetical protein